MHSVWPSSSSNFLKLIQFLLAWSNNFERNIDRDILRETNLAKICDNSSKISRTAGNLVNQKLFQLFFRKDNRKWKKWTISKKKQGLSTIWDAFRDFSSQIRKRHCRFNKEKVKNDRDHTLKQWNITQSLKIYTQTLRISPILDSVLQNYTLHLHPHYALYPPHLHLHQHPQGVDAFRLLYFAGFLYFKCTHSTYNNLFLSMYSVWPSSSNNFLKVFLFC